ncbi:hypothetical protein [Limnohabitans sp. DM1]|uniref:hypothetical protein n=1 Tax=Limnohabitans sp. DM1 TaxID=1597955 RepID=UPI001892A214|nr:hypothetical protein [Limnohabitans sp. DM1]
MTQGLTLYFLTMVVVMLRREKIRKTSIKSMSCVNNYILSSVDCRQTLWPDKKLLQAKLHEFYLANVGEGDAE